MVESQLYNGQTGWTFPTVEGGLGGLGTKPADACTAESASTNGSSAPQSFGNPVHPGSGNKTETEADFATPGEMPLLVKRTYNRFASVPSPLFGFRWISNFDLRVARDGDDGQRRKAWRSDGTVLRLVHRMTPAAGWWSEKPGARTHLMATGSGWTLHLPDNTVETSWSSNRQV